MRNEEQNINTITRGDAAYAMRIAINKNSYIFPTMIHISRLPDLGEFWDYLPRS